MCLAMFKPKNEKFPNKKTLKTIWENNPDGAGLAIVMKDTVKIIKGLMTFDDLMKTIETGLFDSFDVVLHFRWATSGGVTPGLCHPFPVSKDNKDLLSLEIETEKAVIHNGIMFNPNIGDYSDTAIFTKYLAVKSNVSREKIQEIIKDDRLAIATVEGIQLFGQWQIINGIFYSNKHSLESWKAPIIVKNPSRKFANDPYFDSIPDHENFDYDRHDEEDYAFHDNRRNYEEIEEIYDEDELDYCPCCQSDNTELVGKRSLIFECLDCGTAYNETQFIEGPAEMYITKRKA